VGNRFPERYRNKYVVVDATTTFSYDRAFIVKAGKSFGIDLSDPQNIGLYPEADDTLYELLIGIKPCKIILYPAAPELKRKIFALEAPAFTTPDPTVEKLRYMGGFTWDYFPYDQPRLRIHTLKHMDKLWFDLYNDSIKDGKIVFGITVNICKIHIVEPTDEIRRIAREVYDYEILKREKMPEVV
jgi:hypothetical protein